ncbi:hypothetical protein ACI2LO_30910, partial [Streptomyces sp. NPDC033754]
MPSHNPERHDALVEHFGREGLRRFERASLIGTRVPATTQVLLEESGVPRVVSCYFTAPGTRDPLTLGVVAAPNEQTRPPDGLVGWARRATDAH